MKKVIEIKRGEPVPNNAKWLKDINKLSYVNSHCGCPAQLNCSCDEVYTAYDVWEVSDRDETPLPERKYHSPLGRPG